MDQNHEFRIDEKRAVELILNQRANEGNGIMDFVRRFIGDDTNMLCFMSFMAHFIYDKSTNQPVDQREFLLSITCPDSHPRFVDYVTNFKNTIENHESTTLALAMTLYLEGLM